MTNIITFDEGVKLVQCPDCKGINISQEVNESVNEYKNSDTIYVDYYCNNCNIYIEHPNNFDWRDFCEDRQK